MEGHNKYCSPRIKHLKKVLSMLALGLCCSSFSVHAQVYQITLGEVDSQLQNAISNKGGFQKLLAEKIQAALNSGGMNFANGQAVMDIYVPATVLANNCTYTVTTKPATFRVTVSDDTVANLSVTNINSPVDFYTKIHATITGSVSADIWYGVLFCRKPFHATGYGVMNNANLEMEANLHADLSASQDGAKINVNVASGLTGQLLSWNKGSFSVYTSSNVLNFFGFIFGFQNTVNNTINTSLSNGVKSFIARQDLDAKAKLDGIHTFEIPEITDVTLMAELLKVEPYLRQFLMDNKYEIFYYLSIDDKVALNNLLHGIAACSATTLAQAELVHETLYYRASSGLCEVANLKGPDLGNYFVDNACMTEVAYSPTSYSNFCAEALNGKGILGNAAAWAPAVNQANDPLPQTASTKWTLYPGTAMDIGAEPIATTSQPFMKRVLYKTIDNVTNSDGSVRGSGTCKLEMRVYKKNPNATGLKPLLAFHGGAWVARGGFVGLEAQLSHYTDDGFVIFAPFYRLAGEEDGNVECNGAVSGDLVADANDALNWVQQNGGAMGANIANGVMVTGQSAGAHLSMWLVTHRPEAISKGLLLYPPVDMLDFYDKAVVGGEYENWMVRIPIMTTYFGVNSLTEVPYAQMLDNSFLAMVNPVTTPPVYILHGTADSWVPSQQSVALCNVYGGSATNDGGDPLSGTYKTVYNCGTTGSQLHLFAGAGHVLDLRCLPGVACPSGSVEASQAVAESLQMARSWMMTN